VSGFFRFARYFIVVSALCAWAASAGAQNQERSFEQSYRLIPAQPPIGATNKIEVIDFFWYGCPYCYQLLPTLDAWIKAKRDDVVVHRVPAVLRKDWVPDAQLFYTLEVLGEAERLHARVYDAIHKQQLQSSDATAVAEWAVRNGIDRQQWMDAYASAEVQKRIQHASAFTRDYDIRGTPAIVVDGRYQTSGGIAGGVKNMIPIVDALVSAAREQRRKH